MKWSIRTCDQFGRFSGYLSHRNRSSWCKPTAKKHLQDFLNKWPGFTGELEESSTGGPNVTTMGLLDRR